MEEGTKSWIINLSIIVILVIIVFKVYSIQPPDEGAYTMCVMWEEDINIQNLIFASYNFRQQKINWNFHIATDGTLLVLDDTTNEVIKELQCLAHMKILGALPTPIDSSHVLELVGNVTDLPILEEDIPTTPDLEESIEE